MVLDNGTLLAIMIALAGSCFMMVVGLRRSYLLERELILKHREVIKLQAELAKERIHS